MASGSQSSDETLGVMEFAVAAESVPVLVEMLSAMEFQHAVWTHPETFATVVRVYCEDTAGLGAASERLAAGLADWRGLLGGATPVITTYCMRREDWSEVWKQHFHPFRASRRLVVKPSWEPYARQPGDVVIEIDPGMAFGTGQHGTTRACLQFMDGLSDGLGAVSLLDAGCGSAILALAAAKLGYAPVHAFDIDAEAVGVARANLQSAGAADIVVTCHDLAGYRPPFRFRVVVANILAGTLIEYAEPLCSFVDGSGAGGHLILSGILTAQYDGVLRRFGELGAVEQERRTLEGWTSGRFLCGNATARP